MHLQNKSTEKRCMYYLEMYLWSSFSLIVIYSTYLFLQSFCTKYNIAANLCTREEIGDSFTLWSCITVCNWLESGKIVANWWWLCSKRCPSIIYTMWISLILRTIDDIKNLQSKNIMQLWNHEQVVLSKNEFTYNFD